MLSILLLLIVVFMIWYFGRKLLRFLRDVRSDFRERCTKRDEHLRLKDLDRKGSVPLSSATRNELAPARSRAASSPSTHAAPTTSTPAIPVPAVFGFAVNYSDFDAPAFRRRPNYPFARVPLASPLAESEAVNEDEVRGAAIEPVDSNEH